MESLRTKKSLLNSRIFFSSGKVMLNAFVVVTRNFLTLDFFTLSFFTLAVLTPNSQANANELIKTDHSLNKGIFLIATEKLANTSFKETVILLTHYSKQGATGLAINRPSSFPLNEVFPEVDEFRKYKEEVFLGGPVQTNSVFVLMRTKRPHAGMYQIADELYFSAGISALAHGLGKRSSGEFARAYVGYAGWAPGQLDYEIHRGDWLIVHADPNIVFDVDHRTVWKQLLKSWSGQWI